MIHTARLHGRLLPAGPLRLSIARSSIGSNRMSADTNARLRFFQRWPEGSMH